MLYLDTEKAIESDCTKSMTLTWKSVIPVGSRAPHTTRGTKLAAQTTSLVQAFEPLDLTKLSLAFSLYVEPLFSFIRFFKITEKVKSKTIPKGDSTTTITKFDTLILS